jgi:aerobic carbon-monoxide dehydrogenase small subunit
LNRNPKSKKRRVDHASSIDFKVNDVKRNLSNRPKLLLADYLRDYLGYTGVKLGCETSNCGACTVLVKFPDAKIFRAVKSCSVFAVQCSGSEVITIEGLGKGRDLSRIQEIFLEERGLQCGYCTPGFIMAGLGLLQMEPDPSDSEIRHQLSGNLCRCGAYMGIIAAIKKAAIERVSLQA